MDNNVRKTSEGLKPYVQTDLQRRQKEGITFSNSRSHKIFEIKQKQTKK